MNQELEGREHKKKAYTARAMVFRHANVLREGETYFGPNKESNNSEDSDDDSDDMCVSMSSKRRKIMANDKRMETVKTGIVTPLRGPLEWGAASNAKKTKEMVI